MKKKIGFLGGSFDPIHFGHLNMAINLLESCGLEEVWFCPTALSPFKKNQPARASIAHRLRLLQCAISAVPSFKLLDWETKEEGPFYTIDTIRKLRENPDLEIHLLIGEDHVDSLFHWKEAEELLRLAPPLIASRMSSDINREKRGGTSSFEIKSRKVPIPLYDISSTQVRERLRQGLYCGHLLPAPVLDYILTHRLYS